MDAADRDRLRAARKRTKSRPFARPGRPRLLVRSSVCSKGHDLSTDDKVRWVTPKGKSTPQRICLECKRERNRAYKDAHRKPGTVPQGQGYNLLKLIVYLYVDPLQVAPEHADFVSRVAESVRGEDA